MRTREDHLAFCQQRALAYVDKGALLDAVTSMGSDLEQHPETKNTNQYLLLVGMRYAQDGDIVAVRRWINGFK